MGKAATGTFQMPIHPAVEIVEEPAIMAKGRQTAAAIRDGFARYGRERRP